MSTPRTAIVTGGTRGIGAAITARLVNEGAHVAAVFAGNTVAAEELAASLRQAKGSISLHPCDVGDPDACRRMVHEVIELQGQIDHLVNNAGLLIQAGVRTMTIDEWDTALRVNLSASFYLSQLVLPHMIERGFGRIVNIGSITAAMGNPVQAGYGAAKAGLIGFTRSLAREVARKGITVNVVIPGVFDTEMAWSMSPEAQESIAKLIPLGRRGDPDELAHAVCFLLDDRASYLTGSVVTVDGGISMGG